MTDNIVKLTPAPRSEPNQVLIDELERLLERARSGDLIGGALTVVDAGGVAEYHIVGYAGGFSMAGAVACMQARLVDVANETTYDLPD
jgi:hypothetical protein